ncbi:MAG TPA: cytochrome b [Caulobacteraceae bacterium]|nr:cytochrome b [Caulobacteraceae bacterium]
MAEQMRVRYSTVAIILHWTIAALVVANVLIGWQFEELRGPARTPLMQVHKTLGMSILLLTLARIAWRFVKKPPPLSQTMNRWERTAARVIHAGFYVLLIGLPLTGWITVSANENPRPIDMFGLFQIGPIDYFAAMERDAQEGVHDALEETHHFLAKVVVYALVPLHILGALKHQFLDKEDELGRMLPFRTRRPRA